MVCSFSLSFRIGRWKKESALGQEDTENQVGRSVVLLGAGDCIVIARLGDRVGIDRVPGRAYQAERLHHHPGLPRCRWCGGFVIVLGSALVRVPMQRGPEGLDVVVLLRVVGVFVNGHRDDRETGACPQNGAENGDDQQFAFHNAQYAMSTDLELGSRDVLTNPLRRAYRRW